MLGNFDSFLSENRRQTQSGKIYPKFGQIFVETSASSFCDNKGAKTTISVMEKANELKSIMKTKLIEDASIDHNNFDINLSENLSAINLIMEDEFRAQQPEDLIQIKTLMLSNEHRLPNLVIRESLDDVIAEATKLGYERKNIHVIIPVNEMSINFSDSIKTIIESLKFDDMSASEVLSEVSSYSNVGDVYLDIKSVKSIAEVSDIREIRVKTNGSTMTLGSLNRFIAEQFVVKQNKDKSYVKESVEKEIPMLEGFKAFDIRRDVTMIEHMQSVFSRDIMLAPTSANAWDRLLDESVVYFDNGWKLMHNNCSLVLTKANDAMRHNRVCEEYRFEISEAGYPLLDMMEMLRERNIAAWDCETVASAILSLDGCITPERNVIKSYVTETKANRVYHPNIMSSLRPVNEMIDSVDELIRAVANDQFSSFVIGQAMSESMIEQRDINSMMEYIVTEGIEPTVDGNIVSFDVDGAEYKIEVDIK